MSYEQATNKVLSFIHKVKAKYEEVGNRTRQGKRRFARAVFLYQRRFARFGSKDDFKMSVIEDTISQLHLQKGYRDFKFNKAERDFIFNPEAEDLTNYSDLLPKKKTKGENEYEIEDEDEDEHAEHQTHTH